MGLDTDFSCWNGPYSAFMRWREAVAKAAGISLIEMQGYKDAYGVDGMKWETLKPDVLHVLLNHSDCDGWIPARCTKALADRLTELLPSLSGWDLEKTQIFISGLREAHKAHKRVNFH
jgi:hypothetical protein